MHLNNELMFLKYAKSYFKDGMKVLEIGPEGKPSIYCKLVNIPSIQWHGLDLSFEFIGNSNDPLFILSNNEYKYPIEDNTFDVVFSGSVMANVKQIWTWMEELKRITKPGGLIITITNLSWPYCNAPVDCWRIYPDGFKALNDFLNLETVFATYDSLELEYFGYPEKYKKIPNFRVPCVSLAGYDYNRKMPFINRIKILMNQVLMKIPVVRSLMNPVQIAYDTVCIARK